MLFNDLPAEVKLMTLSQTDLKSSLIISKEWNQLTQHIIHQKTEKYLQNENNQFTISLFCCNSVMPNKKFIYKLIPTRCPDSNSISFQMSDETIKTENILPTTTKDEYFDLDLTNHLDLSIDEDQSSIKTYVQIRNNEDILLETSLKLRLKIAESEKISKDVKFGLSLTKNIEDVESNDIGLYEFNAKIKYGLNFNSIMMKDVDFINLVEQKQGMDIVSF